MTLHLLIKVLQFFSLFPLTFPSLLPATAFFLRKSSPPTQIAGRAVLGTAGGMLGCTVISRERSQQHILEHFLAGGEASVHSVGGSGSVQGGSVELLYDLDSGPSGPPWGGFCVGSFAFLERLPSLSYLPANYSLIALHVNSG